MKPVVPFLAGAVLAASLVFVFTRDKSPEPQTIIQTAEAVPSVPAETPPVAESSPSPAPPEERVSRPSAMPAKPARREPVRNERPAPSAKKPEQEQPQKSEPAPPAQTAQNQPPAYQQGPIVPTSPTQVPSPTPAAPEPPKPEPRVAKTVTIPAGTLLTVRVNEALSTKRNQTGDSFSASLDQPLIVDGFVIAERGSKVEGRVAESDPGGRVRGVSSLALELVRLNTADGQRVRLQTESFAKQGPKETKKDVAKVGIAAGIGAAIGAIAGGGKGAAIGAAAGGAAGTGGVMATRGAPAELAAETRVSFRLREPITITEKLD